MNAQLDLTGALVDQAVGTKGACCGDDAWNAWRCDG